MFANRSARLPNGTLLNGVGHRKHRPDYGLLILSLLLAVVGIIIVFAISPALSSVSGKSENYYISKQAIAIVLGLIAFGLTAFIPINSLRRLKNVLIVGAAISALLVQFFGQEVNGASRWIQVGGFSFQSVEFIKFAVLFYAADLLARRQSEGKLSSWKATLRPLLILIAVVGFVVAVLQSDLGSATVAGAIVILMAYISGMPIKKLALVGSIVLVAFLFGITTSAYRRERVMSYLKPSADCRGNGYQACQALIAIGSGGPFGKGLGNSVQAYGYLPEAGNDSIFAIMAEKFGFAGGSILIGLFLALFSRLKKIAEHTIDNFSSLVVCGVLAWLSTQMFINIGAMIGLLPIKGITLPLISFGGTSLIFVMGAIGVVFQISRFTSLSKVNQIERAGQQYGNSALRGRQRRPYYATASRR